MSLIKERVVYKPFEYPKAFDFWLKQQQAHWLHTEVPMAQDVSDWKSNLKDHEKNHFRKIDRPKSNIFSKSRPHNGPQPNPQRRK